MFKTQISKINLKINEVLSKFQAFYGQISLIGGQQATLQNIIRNKPVTYKVTFPLRNQLPEVSSIYMNNNLICSGRNPSDSEEAVTKLILQHTLQTSGQIPLSYQPSVFMKQPDLTGFTNYVESRFQQSPTRQQHSQFPTHPPVPKQPEFTIESRSQEPQNSLSRVNQICGTAAFIPRPLVVGGEAIEKGSWPWLVAVYLNDAKGLSFKCGGNLVTSRTVITAAHCLKLRGLEYKAKHVLIVAGRHNLLDWSESTSITFNADRVLIHPDYKDSLSSFDGDIAMVIVDETIR